MVRLFAYESAKQSRGGGGGLGGNESDDDAPRGLGSQLKSPILPGLLRKKVD